MNTFGKLFVIFAFFVAVWLAVILPFWEADRVHVEINKFERKLANASNLRELSAIRRSFWLFTILHGMPKRYRSRICEFKTKLSHKVWWLQVK